MTRNGLIPIALGVIMGLSACGNNAPANNASAPAVPDVAAIAQPNAAADEPRCVMSCSPDQPRTVMAEISWPLPQRAASREALTQGLASQTLEVTTFKDGFENGRFAELGSVQEKRRFAARAGQTDMTTASSLGSLAVTRVATLGERIASGASRSVPELTPSSVGDDINRVVVVEIEGLVSGLTYWWRRAPGAPVVRCQAPICPFDRGGRR